MTDWTDGYIAETPYTYGYYPELNPLRTPLAFLYAGLRPPPSGTHCELGFGQGLSVNTHAAASGSTWYGCDFNPTQASYARSLAQASGAPAHLSDEAFADFCTRADLPDFDSIGLHGIWSWINDANRAVIVDFVRRKLKVGGVMYISYNTQPGWASMAPMRDLLTEHVQVMGVPGQGIGANIDGALAFADTLLASKPRFAQANPHVAERFNKIKDLNRQYVAHEYFNRNWLPMPFSGMAQWLAPTKLDYACPAFYSDHIEALNLTAEHMALLKKVPDRMFRESVHDFMVNRSFRKDYWVKGARKLGPQERGDALRTQKIVLQLPRADVPLKVNGPLGEFSMQGPIYQPILDLLADHQPRTLGQVERAVKDHGIGFATMAEAVMVLIGNASLAPAQDEAVMARAQSTTQRLNAQVLQQADGSHRVLHLASPVTGGGIYVAPLPQLFLKARSQGQMRPAEWAQSAWQTLQSQGQKLTQAGKTLETAQDNLAELTQMAQTFAERRLPMLKALKVA